MTASLLLKNGIALLHGDNDKVHPTDTDILVEGNVITRIERGIPAPPNAQIIDCTNKIISPGFVDGHQHVWQTLNKGRHADASLLEYMPIGNLTSNEHTKEDIFWGQLGGCLNLLNAGTTTVVDHAHMNVFTGSSQVAISATVSSGIRSIFCYTPTPRVKSWSPLELDPNIEPWGISDWSSLVKKAPFGTNGRVQLGLGYDGWPLPEEVTATVFDIALKGGVRLLSTHMVAGVVFPFPDVPKALQHWGLLDNDKKFHRILLSHATGIKDEEIDLLAKSDVYFASSPSTEMQLGLGRPICFDDALRAKACIGGDCQSNGANSIPGEMRIGLQAERGARNQKLIDNNRGPKSLRLTVEQAFNFGTIQGARAIGMEASVGSVGVGKLADLVVFDANSPGMICAAQSDPVAAVVFFSTAADISTVIVDGVVRKMNGKLCPVQLEQVEVMEGTTFNKDGVIEWNEVGEQLLRLRGDYLRRIGKVDFGQAEKELLNQWKIDEGLLAVDV
ncbi:hypothetical protein PQX77_010150 [Marasmius sp. AFHP31]|nr:hypothetical protein PQX77_010150 [Marasmius sp. AFHP31]